MVRYQSMKNQGDINYVAKLMHGAKILLEYYIPTYSSDNEIIQNFKYFVRNGRFWAGNEYKDTEF